MEKKYKTDLLILDDQTDPNRQIVALIVDIPAKDGSIITLNSYDSVDERMIGMLFEYILLPLVEEIRQQAIIFNIPVEEIDFQNIRFGVSLDEIYKRGCE